MFRRSWLFPLGGEDTTRACVCVSGFPPGEGRGRIGVCTFTASPRGVGRRRMCVYFCAFAATFPVIERDDDVKSVLRQVSIAPDWVVAFEYHLGDLIIANVGLGGAGAPVGAGVVASTIQNAYRTTKRASLGTSAAAEKAMSHVNVCGPTGKAVEPLSPG